MVRSGVFCNSSLTIGRVSWSTCKSVEPLRGNLPCGVAVFTVLPMWLPAVFRSVRGSWVIVYSFAGSSADELRAHLLGIQLMNRSSRMANNFQHLMTYMVYRKMRREGHEFCIGRFKKVAFGHLRVCESF